MSTTKRIARTAVESLALSVVRSGLATAAQRTGSSLLVMAQNTLDCIEDGDLDGAIGYIAAHRYRIAKGG